MAALSTIALLSLLASCSTPPQDSVPRGDALDELLQNSVQPDLGLQVASECLTKLGVDPEPLIEAVANERVVVPAPHDGGSGLTLEAIRSLEPSAQEPVPVLPEPVAEALSGPVELDGELVIDGCQGEARRARETSPPEILRIQLQAAYAREVSAELDDSIEVLTLHDEWAACMGKSGYSDLHRPGDQLVLIQERVAASRSATELENVLDFDRLITATAAECGAKISGRYAAIRLTLEDKFVDTHRIRIEELVRYSKSEPTT